MTSKSLTKNDNFYVTVVESNVHYKQYRQRYNIVVDFRKNADEHRLFLVDTSKHEVVYSWFTSHGVNSGPADKAKIFSNTNGSRKSIYGTLRVDETYYSQKFQGTSRRLTGLDAGINDNARNRAIVLHPAWYVSANYMKSNDYPGRSWGCVTLDPKISDKIVKNLLTKGSIIIIIK